MDKLHVELNLGVGLPNAMDIEIRRRSYNKKLDYLKFPFRCYIWKIYGPLKRACLKENELEDKARDEIRIQMKIPLESLWKHMVYKDKEKVYKDPIVETVSQVIVHKVI